MKKFVKSTVIALLILSLAATSACGDSGNGDDDTPVSGSAWVEIGKGSASGGGISDTSGGSLEPSLALDSSDNPVVAWCDETSGNKEIYVKRWDGSAWVEIGAGSASGGGISNNSGDSLGPSLALDSSDNPVVAWADDSSGTYQIYMKRWNGSSWVDYGPSSSISHTSGDSEYPSLALDSSDYPLVAWHDGTQGSGNTEIYLKRWDGNSWEEMGGSASGGGISNTSGRSKDCSLGLDSSDNPIVAWHDDNYRPEEIYLKRWDGNSWEEMGGSASGGGISNTSGFSQHPSLDIDSLDYPVVAWFDDISGNWEVYIRRWNGSSWVDIAGSASGGRITALGEDSTRPSLVLDSSDYPAVAWSNFTSGDDEIYFKRWDGSSWVELAGSATGGGISDNSLHSRRPSLALDSSGNPVVAWRDKSSGNVEIYIKRWRP